MANEKRLIDANALKERAIRVSTVKEHCYMRAVGTHEIDKAPTVDAVEVVRCKDCKWFDKTGYEEDNAHEEELSLHMGWCANWRRGTQACAFCSYGARRER